MIIEGWHPLPPECCCTVIPGWAGAGESLWVWPGRGILWSPSEYVPGASSCTVLQPCFSSQAPWAVDITANSPSRLYLYGLKYWWYGICAQVGLDGLLPFIPRGRKKNAKEVFTYAGNMTTVINPRLYRNSFCISLLSVFHVSNKNWRQSKSLTLVTEVLFASRWCTQLPLNMLGFLAHNNHSSLSLSRFPLYGTVNQG